MDPVVTGALINAGASLLGGLFGKKNKGPMSAETYNRFATQAMRRYAGFAGFDPDTGYPYIEATKEKGHWEYPAATGDGDDRDRRKRVWVVDTPAQPRRPYGIPTGGMYSGVYTNPEEQAIINGGFRAQAETIEAVKRRKLAQFINLAYAPAVAQAMADSWATEQASKSKLSGEADLMQSSIGELQRRIKDVYAMGRGGTPSAGEQLAYQQDANNQEAGLWSAVAELAGAIGGGASAKAPVPPTQSAIPAAADWINPSPGSYSSGFTVPLINLGGFIT